MSKMRLLLSSVAAILLLGTFGLTEAGRSSALEARRFSDHPVMRSARRTFVDEVADYLNTWAFHSIDRQARSHFTEIFGVNSNDAMKASSISTICKPCTYTQSCTSFNMKGFN